MGKKIIEQKMCVLIFFTIIDQNIPCSKKNLGR